MAWPVVRQGATALEGMVATAVLSLAVVATLGALTLQYLHSFRPLAWLAPVAAVALFLWRHGRHLRTMRPSRHVLFVLLVAVVLLLQSTLLHHSGIHSGRDDGVYALQAWHFANAEQPGFDEPHRITWNAVHPHPDFAGGVPMFPPGYAVLLGVGYVWLGDLGMHLVDGVLVALAAVLLFLVARRLMPPTWALAPAMMFATFYGTLWFSRRYTSESLQLVFLLASALLLFARRPAAGLVLVAVAPLVRVEAILLLPTYVVAALLLYGSEEQRRAKVVMIALAGVALVGALAWGLSVNPAYTTSRLADIPRFVTRRLTELASGASVGPVGSGKSGVSVGSPGYALRRVLQYGLGPLMVLGGAHLLSRRATREAAALFVLASPGLLFLLSPGISPDQPWFFRRFYWGFLPLVILLGTAGLASLTFRPRPSWGRRLAVAGLALLMVQNLVYSAPIAMHVEGQGLEPDVRELAELAPEGAALLLPAGQLGGFAPYLEMRLDVPSVYLKSVPPQPSLPPRSPMTLANWNDFVPEGREPILASEIVPWRLDHEQASPYIDDDALVYLGNRTLETARLERDCDFLGLFHEERPKNEEEGCGSRPPHQFEAWRIEVALYRIGR